MPFDVRRSGHERNIVQVNDLPLISVRCCGVKKRVKHLQLQVELWLKDYQRGILNAFLS